LVWWPMLTTEDPAGRYTPSARIMYIESRMKESLFDISLDAGRPLHRDSFG
jgi:hypothetical protein